MEDWPRVSRIAAFRDRLFRRPSDGRHYRSTPTRSGQRIHSALESTSANPRPLIGSNVKTTGTLSNPRWEAFVQARAKGMFADEAYALAGYRAHRQNAARLMTNDAIKARLAELQGSAAERAMVTIESIADQLDEDRRLAHQKGQAGAAVAASMAKAKLYGLDVERVQVEATHRFANLSDEELRFELGALLAKARGLRSQAQIEAPRLNGQAEHRSEI